MANYFKDSSPAYMLIIAKILLAVSTLRFVAYISGICSSGLQLDFASLYVAGESLNRGLSPFVNYVGHNPSLWDGYGIFTYSRWLYPPLAGIIFQLLALLPYYWAKQIWTLVIIGCTLISIWLHSKILKSVFSEIEWLFIFSAILWFYPLLTNIERGQIDSICLLFLSFGIGGLLGSKRRPYLSGVFFCIATLFKLHCGIIFVYLIFRKEFKVMLGFIATGLSLLVFSILFYGANSVVDYVHVELPRISEYACWGTEEYRVDPLQIYLRAPGFPSTTVVQGVTYNVQEFYIYPIASIPFFISGLIGSQFTYGFWAIICAAFFLLLIFYREISLGIFFTKLTKFQEYIFYQICLVAILLSGPLTWVMNSIWLLPLILFCFHYRYIIAASSNKIGWGMLCAGLFISGLFDEKAFFVKNPLIFFFLNFKPILGEMLCFTGLLRIYHEAQRTNFAQTLPENETDVLSKSEPK